MSENQKFMDFEGKVYSNFKLSKEMVFSTNYEATSMVFYPPNILVCGCIYDELNAFNTDDKKKFNIEDSGRGIHINDTLKFSSNSFFTSCSDYYLRGYTFDSNYKFVKTFELKLPNSVYKLIKLNNSLILAHVSSGRLFIIDVKSKIVLRELKKEYMDSSCAWIPLLLSKKNPINFYVATTSNNYQIKLINYITNEVLATFGKHTSQIYALESFVNSKNEEILFAAGDEETIFVYNSENGILQKKIYRINNIRSLCLIRNSFLCIGGSGGYFEFIHIDEEFNSETIIMEKINSSSKPYYTKIIVTGISENKFEIASSNYNCPSTYSINFTSHPPKSLEEKKLEEEEEEGELVVEEVVYSNPKFSKIIEIKESSSLVNSILLFPPNILLAAFYDCKSLLYDIKEGKKIKQELKISEDFVFDILFKVSANSFLGVLSSSRNVIRSCKLEENFEITKGFELSMSGEVSKLIKLSDTLVLSLIFENNSYFLYVIDTRTAKISRKINYEKTEVDSSISVSWKHESRFYLSTSENNKYEIKSINFEKNEVDPNIYNCFKEKISCITSFISLKNQEILVTCSSEEKFVNFVNSENGNIVFKILTQNVNQPKCLLFIKNGFLSVIGTSGLFEFFHFNLEKQDYKKAFEQKIGNVVCNVSLLKENEQNFLMTTSSDAEKIDIYSINFSKDDIAQKVVKIISPLSKKMKKKIDEKEVIKKLKEEDDEDKKLESAQKLVQDIFEKKFSELQEKIFVLEKENEELRGIVSTKAPKKDVESVKDDVELVKDDVVDLKATKAPKKDLELVKDDVRNLEATKATKKEVESVKDDVIVLEATKAPKKDLETVSKKQENLKKNYLDHFDNFHTLKYEIEEFGRIPQSDNGLKVFPDKTITFRCQFKTISGDQVQQVKINFKGLKVFVNSEEIKKFDISRIEIQFEYLFKKIGKNEILVEFENIKQTFLVEVCDNKLSEEKSELVLPKERFKIGEEFKFSIIFRNSSGLNLPFESISDFIFAGRIYLKNSTKNVRGVLVDIFEENFSDGELKVEEFKLSKNRFNQIGDYFLVVKCVEHNFELKKEFTIEK